MNSMERRNFIQASVAAASGAAWTGCSGRRTGTDFPSYELPAYSAWLPNEPNINDFVLFTHLNAQHLHTVKGEETPTPASEDEDVLLTLPWYGFRATALWFYQGLGRYPWNGTLGSENEPEGMDTEALTMTEGALIFHGKYDIKVFANEFADGFEKDVEPGLDSTIFEGQRDGDTEKLAYAVSEDAVAAAIPPENIERHHKAVGMLRSVLDNHAEEVERLVDDEDGEWLHETTGEADMAAGVWRVEGLEEENLQDGAVIEDAPAIGDNPVFETVDSFISVLALSESDDGNGGDMVTARFAALYPNDGVLSKDELHEELLANDTDADLDVTTANDRAHVAAEVSEDELDEIE